MAKDHTPLPSRSEKHRSTKKTSLFLKWLLFIGLILFLSGAIYVGYIYTVFDQTLDDISSGTDEVVPKEELAKEKPISILLLGLDSRENFGTMNTDVIMVATLNPERKSASIISIPRDTYVEVDGYKGRKANQFYSVVYNLERKSANSEDKVIATKEIKKIFSEFLQIDIDYVAIVNFQAFMDIIDELDGIYVDVDMDMRYVDPTDGTDIDLKKGYQKLTGKQALDFVRYRMSNGNTAPSNDFQRNERQQKVVSAVIDRIKSFDVVTKAAGILQAVGNHVQTDIPKMQLQSLIKTYAGISNSDIQYHTIEGVWIRPYIYLDEESFAKARNALIEQLN